MEEIPPNEFFFDKKRKVVVKREFYQEEGSMTNKFKVFPDEKDNKKEEFVTEIARTLGAYAMKNQFSDGVLKNQLKRKNHLIKNLEAKLATTEEAAKDQANKGIEQARMADKKEIELLKAKLEKAELVAHTNHIQVGQQRDLIEKLQVRLELVESQVINIGIF
jgi:formate dehydrogenase maturation protein FdhE